MPQAKTHIVAIKALSDNYIWAIVNPSTKCLALVDPGDAAPCIAYLKKHQLQLVSLLITHHHIDHVGGIDELRLYCQQQHWPLTIYSPAFQPLANSESLPIPRKYHKHTDIIVDQQSQINIPELALNLRVMSLVGHTLEHIAYYNDELIFCGDTLFSGGCGRIFEGSPEQMFNALTKIAALPAETKIYCSHEYTQANLTFAITADPDNSTLKKHIEHVSRLRQHDEITLPTTINLEREINPFLRGHIPCLAKNVSKHTNQTLSTPLEVFTALRKWKDTF